MLIKKIQIDRFLILIFSFAMTLSLLFLYLKRLDSNVQNYNIYQYNIQRVAILEQKTESLFLQTHSYLNYDDITNVTNEFRDIISFLKNSSIKSEFGDKIYQDILKLDISFQKKNQLVENFKTINSRLTSSIHYLYDLRKTIMEIEKDNKTKELLNQIFFEISQLSMGIDIGTKSILSSLEDLESISSGKFYRYFYKQSYRFIQDTITMREKLVLNKNIELMKYVYNIDRELLKVYNNNLLKERFITVIFFISAFIILFLLLLNYRKILKNTRELLAFRYAVENSDNVVVMTNIDREIEYVNDAFEESTGYTKDEIMGDNPSLLKSDLMPKEFYQDMNKKLDSGQKWQGEFINKRKDGSLLYEKASIVPIILQNKITGFLAIKLDITDYIKQQNRLKRSAIVFENTKDGILILNVNGEIISINSSLLNMSGYNKDELISQSIDILNPTLESYFDINNLWTGKIFIDKKDKTKLPVWLNITAVYDDHDVLINFIAIYTDMSEIIRTQEKADFLEYHDSLTLLPNRKNFERDIDNIFKKFYKNNHELSMMFLGLDRFKIINESLGHSIGDSLLINISKRVQEILPQNTLFARWDGDKFVALLDMEKLQSKELAKDILEAVSKPIVIGKHTLSVTISIGISIYSDDIKESSTLIKNADIAMFSAKDKGKNRFEYYEKQIYLNIQSRLNIEQELKYALEKNELVLNFQPQYDIITKEIIAVETLVRWHNKKLGLVSPVDFIYIAEENGLIIDIGYYIFEEACKAYVRWQKIGINLDLIAINVSSIQFRHDGFLERVQKIIQKTGISPSSIEVELTESCIFEYSSSNISVLNSLRELGCYISIDDFGTGYASMSYLKELPIDTLKIDQSFIADLSNNSYDKTVSKAIIALAHSLNYRVIAEGIETQEQEDLLREYNCDVGQGYLVSKPLEESKLIEFILSHNKKV